MMALPPVDSDAVDEEYRRDIDTGRRVELGLSNNCRVVLQFFPDWNNITFAFYTKDMPGFIIGIPSEDWPSIQQMVAGFNWRGRRQ